MNFSEEYEKHEKEFIEYKENVLKKEIQFYDKNIEKLKSELDIQIELRKILIDSQ